MVEKITGNSPAVFRNDEIELEEINHYDLIMLSPGPGVPDEAGILKDVVKTYAGKKPIFGVCLGLQAIAEVFGGHLINLEEVFHGVATIMKVIQPEASIFEGVPAEFLAARYHSWIAARENLPTELEITAEDEDGSIMAIRHREYPISAVQFHPESILTKVGEKIVSNFIEAHK